MSNPTNAVFALQVDLNGQDRSGAVALTGVDPIRYNNGLWLEEGGRNMVRNPSAETDATAISSSGATITRITSEHVIGAAAFNIVTNGGANNQGIQFISNSGLNRVNVSQQFPSRVWLKGSGTVNVWVRIQNSDATNTDGASTLVTLTSDWQEVTPAIPTSNNTKTIDTIGLHIRTNVTQVITFQADAGMILDNKAYLLSYLDGAQGTGYAWEGTANLSPSTRAASSASISPTGILSQTTGALAFRLTPTIETGLEEIWGECGSKGVGTDHMQWGRDATKHPFVEWSSNDAAYQRLTGTETLPAGTAYDLYLGHTGTVISLAVDAGTLQTGTRAAVSGDFSTGDLTLEASAGGVIYQPFATFDRPLTDTEIATLAARQGWSMSTLDSTTRRIRAQFELRPAY